MQISGVCWYEEIKIELSRVLCFSLFKNSPTLSMVGAEYIITGSIRFAEQRVRIRINLLITATGEVMMTKSLDKDFKCGMFEIQDEIVKSFIGAIGGYYGCVSGTIS